MKFIVSVIKKNSLNTKLYKLYYPFKPTISEIKNLISANGSQIADIEEGDVCSIDQVSDILYGAVEAVNLIPEGFSKVMDENLVVELTKGECEEILKFAWHKKITGSLNPDIDPFDRLAMKVAIAKYRNDKSDSLD